ncbi:PadR family transcriptional regulator [Actinomyces sp. F1_1611]
MVFALGVRALMLELAILGELHDPKHGYELRQSLSAALGPLRRLSFGSLYPALHRLSDQGLIKVVGDGGSSRTSRRQVIYQITAGGREYLTRHLADASVDDDALGLTMRLMSKASAGTRLALLKARRAQVLARREAARVASRSTDSWVRARAELDAQQNEAELTWLDRLIASVGADLTPKTYRSGETHGSSEPPF